MLIDPSIQILAKCHVMSERHPVKLEMCNLSRSLFHLKKTLYTVWLLQILGPKKVGIKKVLKNLVVKKFGCQKEQIIKKILNI